MGIAHASVRASASIDVPTVTLVSSSQPITRLYFRLISGHAIENHNFGIRTSSDLSYNSGVSSSWSGAGVFSNASIQNFKAEDYYLKYAPSNRHIVAHQNHGNNRNRNFHIRIHRSTIPEPEEYALVFGLFALGFVILCRQLQKKRQQTATS